MQTRKTLLALAAAVLLLSGWSAGSQSQSGSSASLPAPLDVGFVDLIRSETTANGETNIPEVGSVKTEEGFRNLYQMSAYAQVKDKTPYPAVLLTTGMNDPRVDPWMPGKLTARLQAATSSRKPVLLRVDYGGGHGGGSGEAEHQEATADRWSFLLWQFGVPGFTY